MIHSSFENIIGNLEQLRFVESKVRERAKSALVVYLRLLIDYKDFRRKEISEPKGYFPELKGSVLELPYLMKGRLELF